MTSETTTTTAIDVEDQVRRDVALFLRRTRPTRPCAARVRLLRQRTRQH